MKMSPLEDAKDVVGVRGIYHEVERLFCVILIVNQGMEMKSTEEIIARAIILVCLSDRCALEENIIEGRRYTKSEREKQREAIRNWLNNTRYMEYATETEREFFDKKIGAVHKSNFLQYQVQYEAVEPCLWSLGLVNQLSDYENFVLEDFHPILQIGMNHSYEQVFFGKKQAVCGLERYGKRTY